jgi:SAM-dependent methyltransferase
VKASACCRLCGGPTRRLRAFSPVDRIDLVRCTACASEGLDPLPDAARLGREYEGYAARRRSRVERPKREHFRRLLADLALPRPPGDVLDVGAAEGDALAAARELWPASRALALEPGGEAAALEALGVERVADDLEGWLRGGSPRRFDLVLLFDVLEHLRDPAAALAALASRHLAPGATAVATFPDVESWSRRLLGRHWPQYKLEHLTYPSRAGVAALGRRAALRTVALRPLRKRLPLDYVLAVGASFGPASGRRLSRGLRAALPRSLLDRTLALRFGEWLWVAQAPATMTGG